MRGPHTVFACRRFPSYNGAAGENPEFDNKLRIRAPLFVISSSALFPEVFYTR